MTLNPFQACRAALVASLLISTITVAKGANWPRHEIFSGAHVNSATAADYDKTAPATSPATFSVAIRWPTTP